MKKKPLRTLCEKFTTLGQLVLRKRNFRQENKIHFVEKSGIVTKDSRLFCK